MIREYEEEIILLILLAIEASTSLKTSRIIEDILLKSKSNYLLLSSRALNAIEALLSKSNIKYVVVIKVLSLSKSLIKSISTSKL